MGFSPFFCLSGSGRFTLWAAASGRKGCRAMLDPPMLLVAKGFAMTRSTGSFSTSATSIFFVRLAKFSELIVSRWYARVGARLSIMTVRPLFCPSDNILVILDSRYGIRLCFLFIASTHCASTKRDLLIAEDSTRRSLLFSVRRLSSEPARSIHDARLTWIVVSVVWVIFTQRTACDREEWALSYTLLV